MLTCWDDHSLTSREIECGKLAAKRNQYYVVHRWQAYVSHVSVKRGGEQKV
jgi:hypothetical protein